MAGLLSVGDEAGTVPARDHFAVQRADLSKTKLLKD